MNFDLARSAIPLAFASALIASPLAAAQSPSPQSQAMAQYYVPKGDLSQSLTEFAQQAGIHLSAAASLTRGKSSFGVQGDFTVSQALMILLAGTGLEAQAQSNGSFLITAAPQAETVSQNELITLKKVVVSAAGFEQKITDAPASISVVNREEIESRPYTTLLDVVRDLEGVDIGETRDKTGQGTISMRGMGADYTLILIDGRRQNNHGDIYPNNFGGNQFNHIPPLAAIERVEVIRGPASTLYGADALGGVINVITKKITDTWGGAISFSRSFQEDDEFGEDSTLDFNVQGPLIPNTLGLAVRGSVYDRDASNPEYAPVRDPAGNLQTRSLGFGGGGKTVDNTNKSLGFRLSWTPDEKQSVVFDYDVSEQVYDNTPSADGSFPLGTVDSIDQLFSSRPRAGYAKDQEFTRDQWSISHDGDWSFGSSAVSLAYIETANKGRTLPLTASERLLQKEIFEGTGAYAGLSESERRDIMEAEFLPRPKREMESRQYTFDAKLDIPITDMAGDHLLVVGTQYIDGELDDGVFGMEDGGTGAGVVSDFTMYSLFVEDNWTFIDPLTVTAGIRYDDHKLFGSNTSPRLYGVYLLNDSWTLKGGVSTGYKTPKTTDLFDGITGFGGQGTSPFVGNPDLKPETSINTELAAYWEAPTGGHNFNITLFQNEFKDKITRGETNLSCSQTGGVRPCANLGAYEQLNYTSYAQNINIDKAEIQGLELAGRYYISPALVLRANYTYTDSEQTSGANKGQPLTNTAENMANATLDWQYNDRMNVFLTLEARSDRYRGVGTSGEHLYYDDYEVFHLGAAFKINESVTVNARINNLLDQDFTSYTTRFNDVNGDGIYDADADGEVEFSDDYNNKDKSRNFWLSVNVSF
ncbi:MAG: outer membrane receptor for ferrienterochelin and colicins [Zhongshania marina]|jgi:outer membrane receptor for ferrienterochelin and colicins